MHISCPVMLVLGYSVHLRWTTRVKLFTANNCIRQEYSISTFYKRHSSEAPRHLKILSLFQITIDSWQHLQLDSLPTFQVLSFTRCKDKKGVLKWNKRSNNFDERPHRLAAVNRFVRPWLLDRASFSPHESGPKRHLDRFSCFCWAHERNQHTHRQKHTVT